VLLGQDRPEQTDDARSVGEDPHHVGPVTFSPAAPALTGDFDEQPWGVSRERPHSADAIDPFRAIVDSSQVKAFRRGEERNNEKIATTMAQLAEAREAERQGWAIALTERARKQRQGCLARVLEVASTTAGSVLRRGARSAHGEAREALRQTG